MKNLQTFFIRKICTVDFINWIVAAEFGAESINRKAASVNIIAFQKN
jgi:hypothetical protein